jgi:polyphosphate kinase
MSRLKGGRGERRNRDGAGEAIAPTRKRAPRPPVPPDAGQYLNRELNVLAFFRRVLEEAQDERNPLLERVKFLSILGSILAEFFMVRVAGLKQQMEAGVIELSSDGLTPSEQLLAIRQVALELMRDARRCLQQVLPLLSEAGIHILDYQALTDQQRTGANEYFERVVFPVLTPLAFDPGRPFPYISNMSMNLAVLIRDQAGRERFAQVKVPRTLPRLLPVKKPEDAPDGMSGAQSVTLVWLEQVIAANLHRLFPGMEVVEAHPFRVTRDAEVAIQQMEAEDLLETIERCVRERRFGSVVRVTVDTSMPSTVRDILTENMGIGPHDLYTVDPPLGTSDLMALHALDRPALKDAPFLPAVPPALGEGCDLFAAIRREDILLHHPYDSFAPIVDLLRAAARDPDVLTIKQTLYRVGRNSPVVEALREAASNGKQVAVLLELKARFDEESNIEWAKSLEDEGVHVVYGLPGLKTHSKILLLVRKEGDGIRRYVHLSTGNYNPVTAQLYTDLGLLTCDEAFGADASDLFNYLTGYSAKREYQRFLVAPINLRAGVQALMEREIDCARQGHGGHLIFKLNHLVDAAMTQSLYRASQAGVKVDLLVRSTCILRPGVGGLSQNIHVTSIVGRFLEHSRVYYFRNGGNEEIYVGSADLMPRNLDRRVEILFPIQDPRLVRYLRDHVLATYLADTVKARRLRGDGTYERVKPAPAEVPLDSQQWLIDHRAQGVVTPG